LSTEFIRALWSGESVQTDSQTPENVSKRDPAHRHSTVVDADPGRLVEKLQTFERVDVPRWL
jgi:hypothetical protein